MGVPNGGLTAVLCESLPRPLPNQPERLFHPVSVLTRMMDCVALGSHGGVPGERGSLWPWTGATGTQRADPFRECSVVPVTRGSSQQGQETV